MDERLCSGVLIPPTLPSRSSVRAPRNELRENKVSMYRVKKRGDEKQKKKKKKKKQGVSQDERGERNTCN